MAGVLVNPEGSHRLLPISTPFEGTSIGDRRATELLIETLNDDSVHLRYSAASALKWMPDAKAVGPLLRIVTEQETEDPLYGYDEIEAAAALRAVVSPEAADQLIDALAHKSPYVRSLAAEVLGRMRSPKGVPRLVGLLKDKHDLVRREAAIALGRIGDSAAADALAELVGNRDDVARREAAWALAEVDTKRADTALSEAIKSGDYLVVAGAYKLLIRQGDVAKPEVPSKGVEIGKRR